MEISNKQKIEIMNKTRHQLSIQHMDSLEYPHGLIVGKKIENNTQAVFDVIKELPDYAVHNIIARLRGNFRHIRKWVLTELQEKDSLFKSDDEIDIGRAMDFLYSHMMGLTKEYLFNKYCKCCGQDVSLQECACAHQQCDDCAKEQIKEQATKWASDGKCWFCGLEKCDAFDTEFDTYLHINCLEKVLKIDPKHPEAIHMKYLLEDE